MTIDISWVILIGVALWCLLQLSYLNDNQRRRIMIPKYVVFNIMKLDLNRNAEVVVTGNSKSKLSKVYSGKAYVIKSIDDRGEW